MGHVPTPDHSLTDEARERIANRYPSPRRAPWVVLIIVLGVAVGLHPLATGALGVGAGAWAAGVSMPVLTGASGRELIAVLRNTGFFTLSWSILAAVALVIS